MPSLVKEIMMREIIKQFEANPYAFMSTFEGMSVGQLSEYRRNLEKVSGRSIVIKRSIAKKIFSEKKYGEIGSNIKGQIIFTFGDRDPQNISKAIVEYAKANNKLVPAGVLFENKSYDKEFVKQLATMPSRKELLTQVVIRVKSPISGFVLGLGQVVRGFVIALNEVKKKKELQTAS